MTWRAVCVAQMCPHGLGACCEQVLRNVRRGVGSWLEDGEGAGVHVSADPVGGISHGDNGAEAPVSKQTARDLCQNMRSEGVIIYSVGFIMVGDDPAAADTLKACAGSTTNYFEAKDGNELRAAFQAIAKDISKLRLSQ